MKLRPPSLLGLSLALAVLSGCASRDSHNPNALPVLYPNAAFKQIRGHGIEGVATADARGAVVGGSGGAVAGAMSEKPNMTYRHFVPRCVTGRDLEIIGWR